MRYSFKPGITTVTYDDLTQVFKDLRVPTKSQLIEFYAAELESAAADRSQNRSDALSARFELLQAVEQFLAVHRDTPAFNRAGLDGVKLENIISPEKGVRHDL